MPFFEERFFRSGRFLAAPLLALVLLPSTSGCAQEPTAVSPSGAAGQLHTPVTFSGYDVVSVKANKTSATGMSWGTTENMLTGTNVSLKMLLANAFGIRTQLISGLPAWAVSDHWDIQAKVIDAAAAEKDQQLTRQQEQALFREKVLWILRDRFQLKAHTEIKEQPVYELVVEKSGSKLKPHEAAAGAEGSMVSNNTSFEGVGIHMPEFARSMEFNAGRNVVDKTGLTGSYDVGLKWSTDANNVNAADNGSTDRLPDFFTALQEELGLKLVPAKGPVTSLVVDSIEQPTAD